MTPSSSQSALRPRPTMTVGLSCRAAAAFRGPGLAAGRAAGNRDADGAVGFEATAPERRAGAGAGLGCARGAPGGATCGAIWPSGEHRGRPLGPFSGAGGPVLRSDPCDQIARHRVRGDPGLQPTRRDAPLPRRPAPADLSERPRRRVDGGSTDDTVERLSAMSDVELIAGVGEQWWTGATWFGIESGTSAGDGRRLRDAAEQRHLVRTGDARGARRGVTTTRRGSRADRPSRGRLGREQWDMDRLVDLRDHAADGRARGDEATWPVDVLEGRGTLVPLHAIRAAGNVDPDRLPHYVG